MSLTDAIGPKKEPERKARPPKNGKNFSRDSRAAHVAYVAAAFEDECRAVRDAPKGTRNHRLNSAAYALGQLVGAGALDESDVERALTSAAADAGLGDTEIGKTIASGLSAGKKEPRELPEPTNGNGKNNHDDVSIVSEPPPDDFGPVEYDEIGEKGVAGHTLSDDGESVATTIVDVLALWRTEGPLVHEPTGIKSLDELTDGGPVYGSRWYASGAPDAGKTLLVVQTAHKFAERGIAIGLLSADEEDSDIFTRFVQRIGYSRRHCEIRDPGVLDEMRAALEKLPVRLYCDDWTIERAADDLAKFAKERGDGRAMLVSDSLQTVACDSELARVAAGGRELSTAEAVTLRTRAIRTMARRHRMIMLTTSELGRSAYASGDPDRQTKTIASSKWSGSIEYAARVLLGVRSVAGEKDIIDIEIAKNKHGPIDEHVYLKIDRRCQTLTETSYTPPIIEDAQEERDERKRARVSSDADIVYGFIVGEPGITKRNLIDAAAGQGLSRDRVYAAVRQLGDRIECRPGKRDAVLHYPKEAS